MFNLILVKLLLGLQFYLGVYLLYILNIYPALPSKDLGLVLSFYSTLASILIYLYFFIQCFYHKLTRQMLIVLFVPSALNMAMCTLFIIYNHQS